MSLLKIPLRSFPRRKARNLLTALAVAVSVSLFIGVNLATESASQAFEDYLERGWGETDLIVTYGSPSPFGQDNLSLLENVEGIEGVARALSLAAFMEGNPGGVMEARGVDPSEYYYLGLLEAISGEGKLGGENVVITRALAENYGLRAGDWFTASLVRSEAENGELHSFRVSGIYDPKERVEFNQRYFFVSLEELQRLSGREGKLSSLWIKLQRFEDTTRVRDRLKELFGPEFEVHAPKIEAVEVMRRQTASFRQGLDAMVVVSLVVCLFLVFNTMFINVRERISEIGILRSVGSSGPQVFSVFFTESFLLGAAGVSLGILLGLLLGRGFLLLFLGVEGMGGGLSFTLSPTVLLQGALAGMMAVLGGAFYPSLAACRVTVDQALRPEMRREEVKRGRLLLAGSFLFLLGSSLQLGWLPSPTPGLDFFIMAVGAIILAALLLSFSSSKLSGVGGVGRLVSRNLGRKVMRTAVCFGIVGMSLSFVVMLGGLKTGIRGAMEESVRESLGADLILISERNLPLGFADNLRAMEGVREVVPTSIVYPGTRCLEPSARSIGIFVVDPETLPRVIRQEFVDPPGLSPDEAYRQLSEDPRTLILPKHLAEELGVRAGENLTLETWRLTEMGTIPGKENFRVVGIFTGAVLEHVWIGSHPLSESAVASFLTQDEYFYPAWGRGRAWGFLVEVEEGFDPSEVRERVDREYPDCGFSSHSITHQEILDYARESIDRVFYILFAVLYFSVLIGAIAIAVVMLMNVTERRREIGILRSQGMSGLQVLLMFLEEAVVVGLVGLGIGLVCGPILLKGTVSSMSFAGFTVEMVLPLEALLHASLLALAAAILGGLYPSYRASRMTIVDSLRR
ncbi:MAG: FtsX-like permease family protein [Candidatus Hadarchaeales archaeon]